jgi:hypothetical protein
MSLNKFDLCSNALMLIGAEAVSDFDGRSPESAAAAQFFQSTTDNWLSLYDWQFATTTAQLSRLFENPPSAWNAIYQAPPGAIKIQNVKVNSTPITYDRFHDKIHCNATLEDNVFCDYTRSMEVHSWPPYFSELMEYALAKKFSTVLAAKIDFKSTFGDDLEVQFRLAKNADARQQTTRRINLEGRGSIFAARRA